MTGSCLYFWELNADRIFQFLIQEIGFAQKINMSPRHEALEVEMVEKQRLQFVKERNGKEAAIAFAKQTMTIYRAAVLASRKRGYEKPHHASLPEYRKRFIKSYCSFKRYIANVSAN